MNAITTAPTASAQVPIAMNRVNGIFRYASSTVTPNSTTAAPSPNAKLPNGLEPLRAMTSAPSPRLAANSATFGGGWSTTPGSAGEDGPAPCWGSNGGG